jgi:CRP-like cAMP-binding protein
MARSFRKSNPAEQENRLLQVLPKSVRDELQSKLVDVSFEVPATLYKANEPIDHVYFPRSGVYSLVIIMEDERTVEVGTVGNEGMLGTPLFLGAKKSPTQCFAQVAGKAYVMEAEYFGEEMSKEGPLYDIVRRYTQALLNLVSQSAACNHLHSIEERMCRWLLMCQDRIGSDYLPLTQEFLAQMLGVRRPSVTVVAGILQKAGLIIYSRGLVTVLDRKGLEAASCECYRVVRDEFDRLLT